MKGEWLRFIVFFALSRFPWLGGSGVGAATGTWQDPFVCPSGAEVEVNLDRVATGKGRVLDILELPVKRNFQRVPIRSPRKGWLGP